MNYTIVIDKQSRTNPSNEKKEISFEIDELRKKGDVHDDLIIENGQAKVIRRIELNKYNVTSVLKNEIIEDLGDAKIPLFEGDNYIYVKDEYNNQMCAEYIVKSDFTDMYVTHLQMNSAIEQTAQSIDLSVSKKLEGYSTTEEMKSEIKIEADGIKSTVSKKVGNDEIISKINQSAEKITIKADKVDIDGKAVRFKTNISGTLGPFTQTDKQKVINHIMGTKELTGQEFKKYDLNNDGEINTYESLIIARAIANGGYYTFSGTYEISPDSINRSIALYDNRGFYQSIISLMYNYFNSLHVGNLETEMSDEKTSSGMGSNVIYVNQDNTSNSIYLQVGNWYNGESSSGISISNNGNDNSGNNVSGIDIVTQRNNAFIDLRTKGVNTEISSTGITTPKLIQTSTKSKKKNIKQLQVNALDLIKNSNICLYNLKGEKSGSKKHIGLVIGEGYNCPDEVISEDGQGVEQYSMTSLAWKAIQELIEENQNLKQRIEKLEAK